MNFLGQLNTNAVFASLYNMVLSLDVFGTGVSVSDEVYGSRRVDGTLYGDKKLYISTDSLRTYGWSEGMVDYNLLTVKKPPLPKETFIQMGVYRQIPITLDDYLSKQAFSNEGAFASFNGTLLAWLEDTKKVYEHTKYLTDISISSKAKSKAFTTIDLTVPEDITGYDALKWQGQELFRVLEDEIETLKEPSRTWNDNGFLRTAQLSDFDIVIPIGVLSNVRKHDVPFLFNPDTKIAIKQIHWKYFGTLLTTGGTSDGTQRAFVEKTYTISNVEHHLIAGDLIPTGGVYLANEAYTPLYSSKPTIQDGVEIYLIHKRDYPIMSAFVVGTSFFNAQTLKTNHYLTFGHNNVYEAHIEEFPLLKVTINVD